MTPVPDILAQFPEFRPKIELDQRFTDNVDQPTREILIDIVKAMDQMYMNMFAIYVNQNQTLRPHQFFRTKTADLSASDDPDDVSVPRSVLQTASATSNEFNWKRAGGTRYWKVLLGVGDGIPRHNLIIHRDAQNLGMGKLKAVGDASVMVSTNSCRPYGDGTQLQFGEWRPRAGKFEFWPSSVPIGVWIYLEQDLPMVEFQ